MLDKKGWPKGPWNDEPDEWSGEYRGYPLIARRGPMGAWCGYVGVGVGNCLHGLRYDDTLPGFSMAQLENEKIGRRGVIPLVLMQGHTESPRLDVIFDVHGSITFSAASDGIRGVEGDGLWWLGFDCSHYNDLAPGLERLDDDWVYRDLEYVKAELHRFVDQIERVCGDTVKVAVPISEGIIAPIIGAAIGASEDVDEPEITPERDAGSFSGGGGSFGGGGASESWDGNSENSSGSSEDSGSASADFSDVSGGGSSTSD